MTRLLIADARTTSGLALLRLWHQKPNPQEQAEKDQALSDHQVAMQQSYRLASLWEGIQRREELKAEYAARLREIEARYAETLTEVHGDPIPEDRRAA
jgi:hypothetical protein